MLGESGQTGVVGAEEDCHQFDLGCAGVWIAGGWRGGSCEWEEVLKSFQAHGCCVAGKASIEDVEASDVV